MQKQNRVERGVGMQNFAYAPAWDEFSHVMSIQSPRAYKTLCDQFPAPAIRSFRRREARQPRFPQAICEQTFQLVVNHLSELDYTGPTSLSCDDTKLFATFRLYWDGQEKAHFLVGGIDGPIKVIDPESVKDMIMESTDKKATKVSTDPLLSLLYDYY